MQRNVGIYLTKHVKMKELYKLIGRDDLLPDDISNKLHCWLCDKYSSDIHECCECESCNTWVIRKVLAHSNSLLRFLDTEMLGKVYR